MRPRWYEILFGTAVVTLVALGVWWTLFLFESVGREREAALEIARLRHDVATLERGARIGTVAGARADEAAARQAIAEESRRIEERHARRVIMVLGEGALMFVLLVICVVMLFRLYMQEARQVRAMRSFVSTVTHEMKTPIAGLKSLVQTAAQGDLPPGSQAEVMRMGVAEAERLEHLVENILIAGRLRVDGQPTARLERVALGAFVDELVKHRSSFLARPGSLVVAFGDGAREAEVEADLDSVRVILENLLDNAYKYGGEDPRVRVGVERTGTGIRIDVTDGGVGFDRKEAEALFTPFIRSAGIRAAASHGTGLGLGIARALARRMGGDVTARSDGPGRGATFSLDLRGGQ